jgi:hypothetical protein
VPIDAARAVVSAPSGVLTLTTTGLMMITRMSTMHRVAVVVQRDRDEVNEVYIFEDENKSDAWNRARVFRDSLYDALDWFEYFDSTILNVSEVPDAQELGSTRQET